MKKMLTLLGALTISFTASAKMKAEIEIDVNQKSSTVTISNPRFDNTDGSATMVQYSSAKFVCEWMNKKILAVQPGYCDPSKEKLFKNMVIDEVGRPVGVTMLPCNESTKSTLTFAAVVVCE